MNKDACGMPIVCQVVDEISPIDIDHRAYREKAAEPDLFSNAPIQDGATEGTALTNEGKMTVLCQEWCESRVQAEPRDHYSKTVRTDDSHPTPISRDCFF